MQKQATRTYSRITRHAAALLSKQIRIARKERKMTAQELADRAGISRGLLQRPQSITVHQSKAVHSPAVPVHVFRQ